MQSEKALVFGETKGFDKSIDQCDFKTFQVSRQQTRQTFSLSFFKHKRDVKPQVIKQSWMEICEQFKKPSVRFDKDGLLFSPALFEPAYRKKDNACEVSMLVLDIDHNAELETLETQLAALDSAFMIYSTHSHLRRTETNINAEPRFRVCLPLASAIPAKDFPALWQYAKHKTGLPLDESAKDASRMFYTPAIAALDAPYVLEIKDGAFLDWQNLPLDSFSANGSATENGHKTDISFEFHEDRHAELCRRIQARAKATGRGGFEMKCPAHNGNGDSSLFYDPAKQSVACLKKPDQCSYFEILAAFGLPNEKLPSRLNTDKQKFEFEETETRIKPFPVPNEKCFDGLAGDFVRLIEPHTEASPMALLCQFLVYFGNIIGRSAYMQIEGDKHFTNLFCIVIGNTAQGRKGTSFGRVRQIFKGLDEHHEKNCLVGGLASGEGLLYQVRDPMVTTKKNKETGAFEETVIDSGVSDKRLLVSEGEFAQVLRVQGREGNTLSTYIRNLWDKGTAQSMTKNSSLKTTDALVSIIGHITQAELLLTLSEVESANGYANRFIFFCVQRSKFLPFGGEIPAAHLERLQDRLANAIKFAREKGLMSYSIEASKLWASVYERLETSRFGYLANLTQRASPYVLRLSLIFALLDKSNLIEKYHLESALSVWQYAEDSARYIFGERLDNQTAEKILSALKEGQEKGLTRTEIRNLFDRHISNQKLNAALSVLLENKLAEPRKIQTGGKPKEVWFLCVKSDKSVSSNSINTDEQTFDAFNANNETNTKINFCEDCQKELDRTSGGQLFCPICLSSY